MSVAVAQAWSLSRRSIIGTFRRPQNWLPGVFFPLLLAAVYTAQFGRTTGQPGFPEVDSFLDFILPASILQGAAFGATNAGSDLALDIENGFFERLLASPVSRISILVGRLAGSMALGMAQAAVFLAVFMVFGARIQSGPVGVVVVIACGGLLALAIGGLAAALALRTGSQEAVQGAFPLVFALLFLSSAFYPTETMKGWYRTLAESNPVSDVIDPLRRLTIANLEWTDVGQALGVTAALATATVGLSFLVLQRRLRDAS